MLQYISSILSNTGKRKESDDEVEAPVGGEVQRERLGPNTRGNNLNVYKEIKSYISHT